MTTDTNHSAVFIPFKDSLDGAYPGLILGINVRRMELKSTIFLPFIL